MKFAHLRTFVAIVDNGGFARAAARLNLTQSADSRQIGALEAELGVTLFDRIGRRVRLTSEGEDLLRHCRRALAEVESVSERARALKTGQTVGLLRVGATPQVIETLLADFLVRYRQRHPGIEVHLIEDGGARLPNRLERGDVHLSIMAAAEGDFSGKLLYPIYVLAVLPEKHRFSRRAVLEVADLADESVVRTSRSDRGSRVCTSGFRTVPRSTDCHPRRAGGCGSCRLLHGLGRLHGLLWRRLHGRLGSSAM